MIQLMRTGDGAGTLGRGRAEPTELGESAKTAEVTEAWRLGPFLLALLSGLGLRLWWVHAHAALAGDPQVYADIARNWLTRGVYGVTAGGGAVHPTLIRLPGYPLFLAACFRIFGTANLHAVLLVQVLADLGTCVLLAAVSRRLWSRRAGMVTLWLAALCPFTATYAAALLTETLELFAIAAALYVWVRLVGFEPGGLRWVGAEGGDEAATPSAPVGGEARQDFAGDRAGGRSGDRTGGRAGDRFEDRSGHAGETLRDLRRRRAERAGLGLALGLCWSYAALLRPDGALLAVTLCPALVLATRGRAWRVALAAGLLSVLPFVPWTVRNWRTFHVIEPLAPRYATDPGEAIHPGFQRWTKTVCVDFACTQEIYWTMDSDVMDFGSLPARAFDSADQLAATRQLFADYNQDTTLTDAEDARFADLAAERIRAHPVRYYLLLPAARVADMWLRPRLELLPNDLRWWQYGEHEGETEFAYAWAGLNLAYLGLAVWGAWKRPPLLGAMLVFLLLRSLLLATIEAPEQRYTLECLPMILVLAGVALGGLAGTLRPGTPSGTRRPGTRRPGRRASGATPRAMRVPD